MKSNLVSASYQTEIVLLQKLLHHISSKAEGHATIVFSPPGYILATQYY